MYARNNIVVPQIISFLLSLYQTLKILPPPSPSFSPTPPKTPLLNILRAKTGKNQIPSKLFTRNTNTQERS